MWQNAQDVDSKKWNQFVATHGPQSGRFLQSWEWGDFLKVTGEDVVRVILPLARAAAWLAKGEIWRGSESVERWSGLAQLITRHLPGFGSYTYCPRGPIVTSLFEKHVSDLARHFPNNLFFRFDPPILSSRPKESMSTERRDLTWHKTISIQPTPTWITDLTDSVDHLSAATHKKTRYNIGVAERHGLRLDFTSRDLEPVWHLFKGTSKRGVFRLHEKEHYQHMLKYLDVGECRTFLATVWKENEPIAANIMVDFAGVRTYLHGASSYHHRAFMAPQLLHWELIKDAKEKGLTLYDWWGVAPEDQPNHPWAGISRFKRSFPGHEISYPGTYDLVQKPLWYKLYQLVRKLRRAV